MKDKVLIVLAYVMLVCVVIWATCRPYFHSGHYCPVMVGIHPIWMEETQGAMFVVVNDPLSLSYSGVLIHTSNCVYGFCISDDGKIHCRPGRNGLGVL